MNIHRPRKNQRIIYDVMYGFIPITEWEEKIINSPFFQRLRWIKQLGFANYVFPGAEHNRFAHVIGVMHSMHQMICALGINVSDDELFDKKSTSPQAMLHKSLRIAALLHDIGTFPFSHSVEYGYIRHGNDLRATATNQRGRNKKGAKSLPNSHEHLGSFIIKNTPYDNGLTQILEKYGLDVSLISKIIKGDSPYLIANQLMHSDLDADRMDYLLRDSHYTGIKYGQFDREYILANLVTYDAGKGQIAFGVRENAAHAVEDFLIARFSWYSQVIKNQASAKFDILSSHVAEGLLGTDDLYQFHDLLQMIEDHDERFFWWNDLYFMNRCQELKIGGKINDPRLNELVEMLIYRKAPKTLNHPLFAHRILKEDGSGKDREHLVKQIRHKTEEIEKLLLKQGRGKAWILVDMPSKDVVFTNALSSVVKKRSSDNLYQERDPVKVVSKHGEPSLLVERDNSLMKLLSGYVNFVPSVYANESALQILKNRGIV